jgi:hypothetical protein
MVSSRYTSERKIDKCLCRRAVDVRDLKAAVKVNLQRREAYWF